MTAREKLNEVKKQLNLPSDKALAGALQTNKTNIDSWVKRNRIPEKWLYKMDDLILIVKEKDQENKKEEVTVPLVTLSAGAGVGIYNFHHSVQLLSLNPAIFPFATAEEIAAIEVIGDSMEPLLRNGDYIIVTPPDPRRQTEDGIYAIRIDDQLRIKSLQFKLDGTINISSINQRYTPETYDPRASQLDFEIVGRMRLHISR